MQHAQNNFKDTQAKNKDGWVMVAVAVFVLVSVSVLFAHAVGG